MLKKQLLTLTAIVGILACGACFGPSHYTPPPPPPIACEGMKNLRVEVRDETEPHRLNSAALAGAIAQDFSFRFRGEGLSAHVANRPEDDGIVEVKIVSVSAAKHPDLAPNGYQAWKFEVKSVVSLTRSNGQVVWQSRELVDSPQLNSYTADADEMWRDPLVQSELLRSVGRSVSYAAAYQASIQRATGP